MLIQGLFVCGLKAQAIIKFDRDTIDVDTVEVTAHPKGTFYFRNIGNSSLVISGSHGSGRAFASYYPRNPVGPNDRDSIVFQEENAIRGEGKFIVTLTINGNFEDGYKVLYLTGYARKK